MIVTGGAGFLGSHLCERLLDLDIPVLCIDSLITGSLANIEGLLADPRFQFRKMDVSDPPEFEDARGIFNLACPASPLHYQADPIRTTMTSVRGTFNLLEVARTCGVQLLQASTSEVYGDPAIHPQPESYRGKYPHQLSGGEQQRVGVARALAADPELLLMDEPFAAVDPITRDALQVELAYIHRSTAKTIVFVTHDVEEALRLATRIAIMHEGRIAQLGSPLDILEHPASEFVSDFVGHQGVGLKLLSVRKVSDRLRPGETADGDPLHLDTSLRDALSAMTMRLTDRLPVCDAEGRKIGVIALADLVR